MQCLAELSPDHKGRMKNTYEEHVAILNAMESGDVSRNAKKLLPHTFYSVLEGVFYTFIQYEYYSSQL